MMLTLTVPAMAQKAQPTPTPTPSVRVIQEDFSLPPGDQPRFRPNEPMVQPLPNATPTSRPTPRATQTASPSESREPVVPPTPATRAPAEGVPQASPPSASPRLDRPPVSEVGAGSERPDTAPAPETMPDPLPGRADPLPGSGAAASPAPVEPADDASYSWLWWLLGAALLVGLAILAARLLRKREDIVVVEKIERYRLPEADRAEAAPAAPGPSPAADAGFVTIPARRQPAASKPAPPRETEPSIDDDGFVTIKSARSKPRPAPERPAPDGFVSIRSPRLR
ncbi:hypothetical protein BMF35_a2273 [Aurantiacibacter gangjinensis]|uniref:Uncharacterized protein n=2 Tax=Aurantiacibacter gangjinensis TaxID=502682 RepID=A0A0G9MRL9_9SPHN|nr:hypothetical protein BMF35_a2273 [Aurantiacibacter gangjinensis]KLE33189.1 hypothetical protein AAW01_04250 [Aurantiacibacter gangjinensis]